jgi:hypothetical protein
MGGFVPGDAGSVEELHEIAISRSPETGRCRCLDCGGCTEEASGHHQVLEMLTHAAMHAAATGHRVREHSELDSVVGPRGARGVLHAA